MRARLVTFSVTGMALLTLTGCIPSGGRCFPYMQKAGYFCYKAHNFGKDVSENYKRGVHDGCRTAEGTFRRNYSLSGTSEDYRKGWDAGRAFCKLIVPDEAKPGMRTQYQQAIDEKKQ